MLGYHFKIAAKSLRRSPGHALLLVAGIALGVAVATVFSTIRHTFAKDPIPEKSAVLHYVRMNNWDPMLPHPDGVPPQIAYIDAMALARSDIPLRQSPMFPAELNVSSESDRGHPARETARLCFSDFFSMFNVPFRYGSGWDRKSDDELDPVVVLGKDINDRLFGGTNSVGKRLHIEDRSFRVVGVLDEWAPTIRVYDLTFPQHNMVVPESIFLPFNFVRPMQIRSAGSHDGWKAEPRPGFEGELESEDSTIQMWVELPTKEGLAAYRTFLDGYVASQRRLGRFQARLDNRVTPLLDWVKERQGIPPETDAMMIVSLLFLMVCAMNLMGVLMAKFLARAPQIGVHRALGARRRDIFVQLVLECELVALAGGMLGVLVASIALLGVNAYAKSMFFRADLFAMDGRMLAFAVAVSLMAGLLAGLYPVGRRSPKEPFARIWSLGSTSSKSTCLPYAIGARTYCRSRGRGVEERHSGHQPRVEQLPGAHSVLGAFGPSRPRSPAARLPPRGDLSSGRRARAAPRRVSRRVRQDRQGPAARAARDRVGAVPRRSAAHQPFSLGRRVSRTAARGFLRPRAHSAGAHQPAEERARVGQ